MEKNLDDFHNRLSLAVLPSLAWTAEDSRMVWKAPHDEWWDCWELKALKKKGCLLKRTEDTFLQEMRSFVEPYIKSVQKGYKHCYDYLFFLGDIVLAEMVQMHLENKFGKDSPELEKFADKGEKLWGEVVKIRSARKHAFLKKEMKRLFSDGVSYGSKSSTELQALLETYFKEKDKIDAAIKRAEAFRNLEKSSNGIVAEKQPNFNLNAFYSHSER